MSWSIAWPLRDEELRGLSNHCYIAETARRMELPLSLVTRRAKHLGLDFPSEAETKRPSKAEWVATATRKAQEARIPASHVLGGAKHRKAVKARWEAWRDILDGNRDYSINGVATVSGFDHTSILHGMKRLGGLPAKEVRCFRP